ncbi:hypothetical protein [Flavobacterium ginsenosidimutans]|uniref:hypothetical protein n=1 Tax=Flavobacterium ginsenosidimutans TaxID=687844 RepID=UPI000DAD9F6A|nr:hypothetical protein [Flavobacterium ginsenosidimutans]KAF2331710.1 hypothetical protein DM444_10945 [Flavobacterium ginsenosidimutans]
MKKLSFILFVLSILLPSCSNDESTREEESARLEKMYKEIVEYSQVNSKPCTNPEDWAFMKFGASNCSGYILYNKQIDVAVFQKKIDQYIAAKGKFDVKWEVFYDCMELPVPTPSDIKCIDGKPAISYSTASN